MSTENIPKRGTYVNRSVYQKVVEENRKLVYEIGILTREETIPSAEKILTIQKWRKKFQSDKRLAALLKIAAKEYLKEHPELDLSNRTPPKLDSNPKAFR